VHPFPNRVECHVRPGGRRWGGTGKGPAHLVLGQWEAVPKREQDGVRNPGWYAGEKMIEEGLVKFGRSGGTWELREAGRRAANGELLGRPHRLRCCRGQEEGPVIPLCLLDGLEVSGPRRPCGGEEGGIDTIPFGGAER